MPPLPPDPSGALPNLVIIGAQKCGTTSLHSYLALHPDISMSEPKELKFFVERFNWNRGLDWYRSHFDRAARVRGESSPTYTADPSFPGAAEKMAAVIPDAKLIYLVRDPIDRIRAQWIHNYARRNTNLRLRRAARMPAYISRSSYFHQLSRFLEHYRMEQILVVDSRDLLLDRRRTLAEVFTFLGVQADFWDVRFSEERLQSSLRKRRSWMEENVGARYGRFIPSRLRHSRIFASREFEHSKVTPRLHARLSAMLAEDVAAFRQLTGRSFDHWSL